MDQNVKREKTIVHAHGGHGRLQLSSNVGGSYTPPAPIVEIGMERCCRLGVEGMKGQNAMDGSHYGAPDV